LKFACITRKKFKKSGHKKEEGVGDRSRELGDWRLEIGKRQELEDRS